jgi:hypothetical protein
VLVEQQAWEMPPFESMHEVPDPEMQAAPVQLPSWQVPAPQAFALVCGPALSEHVELVSICGAWPVVSGSLMSSEAVFWLAAGMQALERKYCWLPAPSVTLT